MDPIPYIDLSKQNQPIKEELMAAISDVLDNNAFILGPEVEAFEEDFASYSGSKHAIAVNSGTSALHIGMLLLGVGPGDEVITTPFTFAATAWAISYVGAKPVFVDIEEDSFNMDPRKIEAAITEKTKAICAVHLYGYPCDMDPILAICEKHNIRLIEDAAQAHGARYKGTPVGTLGQGGAFSFYPPKNLGACGEGGALITDDDDLANRARMLRNQGSVKRYFHDEVGYNYRMNGIQGAVLRIKLKHLDKWNAQRKDATLFYNELLKDTPMKLPIENSQIDSAYHLYTVATSKREALCEYLQQEEIGFSRHYPLPLHLQPCYRELGYKKGCFPIAERLAEEILNLPLFPGMTKDQSERVASVVCAFFKEN